MRQFTEHQRDVFLAMWRGLNKGQRAVLIPHLQSLVVKAGLGVNPFAMIAMMSDEMQDYFRHNEGTDSAEHASNVSEFFIELSDLSVEAVIETLAMIGVRPPQYVDEKDIWISSTPESSTGDTA